VRGFGREPPANVIDVHPVSDFQSAGADPGHQAGLTQDLRLGGTEHRIHETDTSVELCPELLEPPCNVVEL
jgi:hypothetical protein